MIVGFSTKRSIVDSAFTARGHSYCQCNTYSLCQEMMYMCTLLVVKSVSFRVTIYHFSTSIVERAYMNEFMYMRCHKLRVLGGMFSTLNLQTKCLGGQYVRQYMRYSYTCSVKNWCVCIYFQAVIDNVLHVLFKRSSQYKGKCSRTRVHSS